MTIIFPPNPVIDDEFDAPNGQIYKWDGDVWVKSGEAFVNLDDYVLKAGDTMEGPLLLDAMTNDPRCAVYREWVEGLANGGLYQGEYRVALNQPDLRGALYSHGSRFVCTTASPNTPEPPVGGIPGLDAPGLVISNGSQIIWDGPRNQWDLIVFSLGGGLTEDLADLRYLRLTGAAPMTGMLTLATPQPTANAHATRKDYVDGWINTRVAKGGDTMIGSLTLHGNAANVIAIRSESQKYIDFRRDNNTNRWRLSTYNGGDDRFELRANTNAGTFDTVEYYDRQTWNGWTYGNWSCSSLTQRSDKRLKVNVKAVSADESEEAIKHLNPVRFRKRIDSEGRPVDSITLLWGFIADDIEQGSPGVVTKDSDGVKGYDVAQVLAIAVAEIKRLGKIVEELTNRL